MTRHEFRVSGMTCGHCGSAITEAVRIIDPKAAVAISLDKATVTIESALSQDALADAISGEGYEVTSRQEWRA